MTRATGKREETAKPCLCSCHDDGPIPKCCLDTNLVRRSSPPAPAEQPKATGLTDHEIHMIAEAVDFRYESLQGSDRIDEAERWSVLAAKLAALRASGEEREES